VDRGGSPLCGQLLKADDTLLELRAETHWPRGLGLPGNLVEAAILGKREVRKELARLKVLIEGDLLT
jgi:hypothetical protein